MDGASLSLLDALATVKADPSYQAADQLEVDYATAQAAPKIQKPILDQLLDDPTGTISKAAINAGNALGFNLPSGTEITVWIALIVVGILGVAYIAHKTL